MPTQQEEYETELEVLVTKIKAAQDKMATPVQPTTMEEIRKQLEEHDVSWTDPNLTKERKGHLNMAAEKSTLLDSDGLSL